MILTIMILLIFESGLIFEDELNVVLNLLRVRYMKERSSYKIIATKYFKIKTLNIQRCDCNSLIRPKSILPCLIFLGYVYGPKNKLKLY